MNNEERILAMLTAMQSEMGAIRSDIGQINGRLDRLETTQAKQGEQLAELKEDVSELRETAVRVAITQENIILPRLDTLADGHKHLLDTLASKSRVEALEDDVSTLKSVVKSMSSRLAALEKAQ